MTRNRRNSNRPNTLADVVWDSIILPTAIWESQDGTRVPILQMAGPHVVNAIDVLRKNRAHMNYHMLPALLQEAHRRNLELIPEVHYKNICPTPPKNAADSSESADHPASKRSQK